MKPCMTGKYNGTLSKLWLSLESPCQRVINSLVTIIRISLSPLPPYQGLNQWLGIRKYGPYLDKKHQTIVMCFLTYWKDIERRVHWHQSSKPGQHSLSWQIRLISSCLFYSLLKLQRQHWLYYYPPFTSLASCQQRRPWDRSWVGINSWRCCCEWQINVLFRQAHGDTGSMAVGNR